MSDSGYTNAAQQRVLAATLVLAGHEAVGLAPSQLAKALRTSASNVTRDLANLVTAGIAEKLESGNYRLGPRLVQVAIAHQRGLADIKARVEEIEQRYSRHPR
jgi:DNA-binding IclR family transcriptional regulator